MRHFLLSLLLIAMVSSANAQLPNISSQNVTIRDTLVYPGQTLANVWGCVIGGVEYALVGARNGMSIVNISNPDNVQRVLTIPGPVNLWKEIKTFSYSGSTYAYIATEGGGGLQVVNLTGLTPTSTTLPYQSITLSNSMTINKIHALQVDEVKGILYLYGGDSPGYARAFNLIPDPYNPVYISSFTANGYVHDGYANNDTLYCGHIYAGQFTVATRSGSTFNLIGSPTTTPGSFTHNTWRSGNTLFTTDEVNNSFLTAFDITTRNELDRIQSNPGSNSMVHNTYIRNGYAITSWYKDGFTIVDVNRPANMIQVGHYDTYNSSGGGSNGCWGVYPYFPSGTIIASNINGTGANASNGELFVCTPNYIRGCYIEGTITQPNPLGGSPATVPLEGALVELVSTTTNNNSKTDGTYKMGQLTSGTYTFRVSKSGFQTYTQSISISNGNVTTVNVLLLPIGLPVLLTEFKAEKVERNSAILTWKTAAEINHAAFKIEHSTNVRDWKVIGTVPGSTDTDIERAYSWPVSDLANGPHYFRLAQVDITGATTYSDWRSIYVQSGDLSAHLQPNITSGETTLVVDPMLAPQSVSIEVFNSQMQSIGIKQVAELEKDQIFIPISLAAQPVGTYFVVLKAVQDQMTLPLIKY